MAHKKEWQIQEVSINDEDAIPARSPERFRYDEIVREAIAHLPAEMRFILLGKYVERRSLRDLAKELRVPYKVAKCLHRDAKELMRLFLQGRKTMPGTVSGEIQRLVDKVFGDNDVISSEELVEALRISPSTISRAIARGELEAIRVGPRRFRFTKAAVLKYLNSSR